MKTQFQITDSTTVTNRTVLITLTVSSIVGGRTRLELEGIAERHVRSLFDTNWAFSNYSVARNGLSFSINASTRIDARDNDQLSERLSLMNTADITAEIIQEDDNMPPTVLREGEQRLRKRLIEIAHEEAAAIGGVVKSVVFEKDGGGNAFRAASFASKSAESLGKSAVIAMTATVVAKIKDRPTNADTGSASTGE